MCPANRLTLIQGTEALRAIDTAIPILVACLQIGIGFLIAPVVRHGSRFHGGKYSLVSIHLPGFAFGTDMSIGIHMRRDMCIETHMKIAWTCV